MNGHNGKLIENIQIVLYVLFLFLWFISPKIPALRIVSIVLLICFSLIQIIKILRRKKIFISKLVLCYVFFACWALLSVIWAQDSSMVIDRVIDVVCNALFLILSYDFFYGARISKKAFISIFVIVGILFVVYIFMYYGIDRYFSMLLAGKRVGSDIINVNFIGLVSTITIIVLLYLVLNNIYKNKLVLLAIVPLLIVALGSGSKKVLIGLVIGVVMVVLFYLKGKLTWKKVATISLFFVLLVGSIFVIGKLPYFETVFSRMETMFTVLDEESTVGEGSTATRRAFIEEGFSTFLNRPITGIGLNNSGVITRNLIGIETYLHCNYVELLACLGIVGFILYYAIYLIIIVKSIQFNKNNDEKNYLPIVMIVTFLAIEIGCVTYYEIKTAMYFILMAILIDKQNWVGRKKSRLDDGVIVSDETCSNNDKVLKEKNE